MTCTQPQPTGDKHGQIGDANLLTKHDSYHKLSQNKLHGWHLIKIRSTLISIQNRLHGGKHLVKIQALTLSFSVILNFGASMAKCTSTKVSSEDRSFIKNRNLIGKSKPHRKIGASLESWSGASSLRRKCGL